ncbi:MAG: VOC family protein [Tetragenococcus sp.]|nr:VOC family protein [Tetragenococcus sp.]
MSVLTLTTTTENVTIAIRVKDRDKMIDFYQGLIGFALKQEENTLAIMGVKEKEAQHLWLEESPRAEEYFGEMKKLQQATLTVSSVEELSDLYQRLKEASYPIVQTSYDEKARIVVDDPEKNRLEVVATIGEKEVKNDEQLLALATGKFAALSKYASFQGVHLNVTESQKEEKFLQNILGFYLGKKEATSEASAQENFGVTLHTSNSQAIDMGSDDVLGLEIIRFIVTDEVLTALEQHLAEEEQAFYIDKKKTLLTVYDPVGIEWWFVRKSDK